MSRRFNRHADMPRFKDPVKLRRENSYRARLYPGAADAYVQRRLASWPTTPHVTLPARPTAVSQSEVQDALDYFFLDELAVPYDDRLSAAMLLAKERAMRRVFGSPYEEYDDDPLLR